MRIDKIELYLVDMPMTQPWETAYGRDESMVSVLVKAFSGEMYGWGESTPIPLYSPESPAGAYATCRDILIPKVLGEDIPSGEYLQSLLIPVKGNYFAKAAIDLAWWDLYAKMEGAPLWKVIGGVNRVVTGGHAFGVEESYDALIGKIRKAVEDGALRVKLKYKPGWDLDIVAAVRKEFPDLVLHIDCNSGYTLEDIGMFKELDRFNLAFHEQPLGFDDLIDHAELAKQIKTPICLDESIKSADHARKAAQIGSCKYVNIKPGRVGGMTNALKVHDICKKAGIINWIGGMLESALGTHYMLALGTLPNIGYPNDIGPMEEFYPENLCEPNVTWSGPSQMTVPDTPGCGTQPNPDRLEKLTVERELFVT